MGCFEFYTYSNVPKSRAKGWAKGSAFGNSLSRVAMDGPNGTHGTFDHGGHCGGELNAKQRSRG